MTPLKILPCEQIEYSHVSRLHSICRCNLSYVYAVGELYATCVDVTKFCVASMSEWWTT